MNKDTALADIMALLNVTTPDGAVDAVHELLEARPVLGIDAQGRLRTVPGMTIGAALQLIDAARASILNTQIAG